ncbi:MAG: LacI family DNA-binding transcriptional regulator [Caulobacteraceae bacterium]
MSDVASVAGVSLMTVSRVISDHPRVLPQTREKVLSAIEALQFKPNRAARALATKKGMTFALLVDTRSRAACGELLAGAQDECDRHHAELLTIWTADPASDVASLAHSAPDGVILHYPREPDPAAYAPLHEARIPAVAVGARMQGGWITSIPAEEAQAGQALAAHLLAQGHRRFLFIRSAGQPWESDERERGFLAAVAAWAEPCRTTGTERLGFLTALDPVARILDGAERPSAVVGATDFLAAAASVAAVKLGLRIPDDVSICGFGDDFAGMDFWPELTTTQPPARQFGQAAILRLLALVQPGGEGPVDRTPPPSLAHRLMIRRSTGASGGV